MKVFQILGNLCHYDATPIHSTLEDTVGKYAPDIVFVEAPDYVFEGWGYDETKEGDARFLKPTAPEGWYYDDVTGQFKQINPPEEAVTSKEDEIASLQAQIAALQAQLHQLEDK